MSDTYWYLVRSTGIVATVLAVAALTWGFLFSARETGTRRRPNWWLDLHNWLGGLTLIFTLAHIALSVVDRDLALGLVDVLVPGIASSDTWPLAWGIIATYLFATAVLTSWPRRLFSRRTWRILHLGSVLGLALAMVHGFQIGTDASTRWYRGGLVLLVGVAVYVLVLRIAAIVMVARDRR